MEEINHFGHEKHPLKLIDCETIRGTMKGDDDEENSKGVVVGFIVSVIDEMRLFLLGFIIFPFRAFLREMSMLTTFITPELAFVYASTTSTFSIAIFVFGEVSSTSSTTSLII
uniref:Uncharacterized protein n=1 Tax=Tanacetum cinerariifolium TaxID=118510 RepID=A0A699IQA3_TANCI|nr:hypothetical protein [Tanacetum cinerariifolium]